MKRKESKLPLVLAAAFLAWFIYWAFGYVGKNKSTPIIQQPIEAQAKMPARADTPEPQTIQKEAAPSTPVVSAPPSQKPGQEVIHARNPGTEADIDDTKMAEPLNRKIAGMSKASTDRH